VHLEEVPRVSNISRKAFFEDYIWAVDPSFLHMFTFPLIKGDKNTALDSPYSLVVTQDIAEKYFGEEDPLGKVISVNNQYDFTITGVMNNVPHNSYFRFEIIIPYEFLRTTGQTNEEWGSNSIHTYVQLQENIPAEQVNEKISGFIRTHQPENKTNLVLMPFTNLRLHEYAGWEQSGDAIQYVYIFSLIAFFVLLIACINFMNLSTARSSNRAKEVGLRKVIGAQKRQIDTLLALRDVYLKAGCDVPEVVVNDAFNEYDASGMLANFLPILLEEEPDLEETVNRAMNTEGDSTVRRKAFQDLLTIVMNRWIAGEIDPESVESWERFTHRVIQGVQEIVAAYPTGKTVAVFTSGGPISAVIQYALETSDRIALALGWVVKNASINEFKYRGDRFSMTGFNMTPHFDEDTYVTYR